MLVAFDLLAFDGGSLLREPLAERRRLLGVIEAQLPVPVWQVSELLDDGHALFAAVCERGLEGIVCKRLAEPYRPGERRWVKVKNPAIGGGRTRLRGSGEAPSGGVALRCAECGRHAEPDAAGWRGYRADDPRDEGAEPELVFFCPVCAAREFGWRYPLSSSGSCER